MDGVRMTALNHCVVGDRGVVCGTGWGVVVEPGQLAGAVVGPAEMGVGHIVVLLYRRWSKISKAVESLTLLEKCSRLFDREQLGSGHFARLEESGCCAVAGGRHL